MSAKKTSSSLSGLTFFLVPSTWLLKAWPMLSAGDSNPPSNGNGGSVDEKWRERVGMIQNGELLSWDRAVSSSDEEGGENGNSKPPKLRKQQKPPDACPLRSDLAHGEDYFLLGPSAWLLVKEKFGSDEVELGRPCVFHNTEESLLAVAMDQPQNGSSNTAASSSQNKQLIPIPPAGYFPYGRLIKDLEGDSESFLPQGRGPHAPQQQPLQQASERKQTDVVSDEDADPNDLVSPFLRNCASLKSARVDNRLLTWVALTEIESFRALVRNQTIWCSAGNRRGKLELYHSPVPKTAYYCCLRQQPFHPQTATMRGHYILLSRIWNVAAIQSTMT